MLRGKLQKYIFTLLLIFLPTQLGLHFWPEWSYVSGVRVDYLAPILYVTDILILLLFLLEIYNLKFTILNQLFKLKFSILIATLFIGANIYFSISPPVSIYKWVKVAEMAFLVWFTVKRFQISNFKFQIFLVPVVYESILAVWQFINQASVGGVWYWLGERSFNSGTPGIANAYLNGQLVLRPYGTFPHPNVLGGFLAVVLPLILWQFLHNSRKLTAQTLGILLVVISGYTTLFLTMSRAAILVGLGATLVILWQKLRAKTLGILGVLGIMGILIAPRFLALGTETEPILAREQLNNQAIEQFTHSPIWGTGLGTAPMCNVQCTMGNVKNYALAFQPPHNIYLLLLAETGILGLLGVLGILGRALKGGATRVPLLTILFLGLFDHYFLTLQQGQLIFSLILGLSLVTMNKAKN